MSTISAEKYLGLVNLMMETIIENEVPFCELDSHAGDGDFGMSLAKGFKKLKEGWDGLPKDDIGAFMKEAGMIITEHCGGASGPIWGTGFRSAGKSAAGKTELTLQDLADLLQASVDGVQKRGGAKLGDKTLLDALIPATESLKASASAGEELVDAMKKAAAEAVAGAEKTKDIAATKGRASYVGDRSISHPDAGATAIGILFTKLAESM